MGNEEEIGLKILKLNCIPPLPETAQQTLVAINDPDIDISKLVNVLSKSPELTGRLIGLANSAYFGHAGKILTLEQAIIRVLGLSFVKSITYGIVFNDVIDTSNCKQFDTKQFWFCSFVTGALMEKLNRFVQTDEKIENTVAYTSGLLLHIGLLAMVSTEPKRMHEIFSKAAEDEQGLTPLIKEAYGLDHYYLGALLMDHWKLPTLYTTLLQEYSNQDYLGKYAPVLHLLRAISPLAKQLYFQPDAEFSLAGIPEIGVTVENMKTVFDVIQSKASDIEELAGILVGG
ncbi:MAG: HDOD domain-containing protein [Methylococcaceae bacterium]